MATIKVMVYEPGKRGDLREIPDTLEAFQEIVGGYVEAHHDTATGAFVYCDEDGTLKKLPPNRQIGAWSVVGNALLCRHDGADTVGLTDEQVTRIKALYG